MNELKKYRNKNNYSCEQMAKILGISKTYYWQLEKGTRRVTYDMAIKIADVFGVMPDDLFYEETKRKYYESLKN